MQAKSFIDILAHELRKEIRAEVEAELAAARMSPAQKIESAHKADQVHLWLNLKMGGAVSSGNPSLSQSVNRYQASGSRRQSARSQAATAAASEIRQLKSASKETERTAVATTIEQTIAVEFFRREGSSLGESFSESQLKSEFRKIAMRIHPDRHTGATSEQLKSYSARFQTLVESAETLEAALK